MKPLKTIFVEELGEEEGLRQFEIFKSMEKKISGYTPLVRNEVSAQIPRKRLGIC